VAILLDQLLKSYQSFMQGALTAQTEVLNIAREMLAGATQGHTEELIHLVPELGSVAERFPFNQVCRGPQHLAWGELPMADIKAIRESCGGTVNDVVLTVITSTVRRYAEQHGVKVKGRQLRLIVPINVRGNGDVGELGNKITFLPVNVPLDVRDPRVLLARISERITFLRGVGVPEIVGMFGMMVSKVPLPVQAALVPLLTQLPLSLANMICTNVPGPQLPLYLLGHKLLRCYPYVPIGGLLGINVAILSYDGVAYVGFGGDVFAVPDIERFEDMLRASFAELREAAAGKSAGVKATEKPTRATGRPRPIERTKTDAEPRAAKPKAKKVNGEFSVRPKRKAVAGATSVPFTPGTTPLVATVAVPEVSLAHTGD
jgi:diacylglycerol O-acyltransferase